MKDTIPRRDDASPALDTLGARLGFVLVVFILAATLLVGGYEYVRGHRTLVARATADLTAQGRLAADRLQRAIDQRRRLVAAWADLEAAQDLAVDDIDKRLASSLLRLAHAFGGPDIALGIDTTGTVMAASHMDWMGETVAARPWSRQTAPEPDSVQLRLSRDPTLGAVIATTAPVKARTGGRDLGQVVLLSPWPSLLTEAAGAMGSALEARDARGRLLGPDAPSPGERLTGHTARVSLGADTIELTLSAPTATALRPLRTTRRQLILFAIVILAITLPASWLLTRSNTAALRRLTEDARRIEAASASQGLVTGGLSASEREMDAAPEFDVGPRAPREVRVLASALATMVDRLESSRRELAQQESLAAVGTMAAVLAHEIRTPLSVLRGSTDMLAKRVGDDPRDRELVSFIEEETGRLGRLVNDLLVFARPRPPELEAVDLAGVATRVARAMGREAETRDVAVVTDLAAAPARGDEDQLYQVALNLATNAVQASDPDTEVRIRTGTDGGRPWLEVADDGPGIPSDELAEVWTPFFTTRRGGTGLGLPLVRRIARAHGGDAVLDSTPGSGTRVRVTLPIPEREGT